MRGLTLPHELLLEVEVRVSAELGRCRMPAGRAAEQSAGAILDLDKAPDDPVDLLCNGRVIGRGRLVVVEGEWALRIDEVDGASALDAGAAAA